MSCIFLKFIVSLCTVLVHAVQKCECIHICEQTRTWTNSLIFKNLNFLIFFSSTIYMLILFTRCLGVNYFLIIAEMFYLRQVKDVRMYVTSFLITYFCFCNKISLLRNLVFYPIALKISTYMFHYWELSVNFG